MKTKLMMLMALGAALVCPADVTWWSVPAMSGVQRLPDAIPADGVKEGVVRIAAARGEYEPGSCAPMPIAERSG